MTNEPLGATLVAMSTTETSEIEDLADLWRWFSAEAFGTYSPLYAAIGRGVADDPDLIRLTIEAGPASARFPLVLMAGVHELVLLGLAPELAAAYDEWRDGPASSDPFPAFRAAALDHRDALLGRMATETTQTNEVGRSALIGLALAHVVGDLDRWALVEAGASAGINLRYDGYRLDYGEAGALGDPSSPVRIDCRPVRPGLAVPTVLPVPVARVGLDQDPIDLTDDDARRWLLACTWPDTGRLERTAAAHEIVAADPPRLVAGDMVEDLPALLDATAPGDPIVVLTTWAAGYLTPDQRVAMTDALAGASRDRSVTWLTGDQPGSIDLPEVDVTPAEPGIEPGILGATTFAGGQRVAAEVLAVVHPHGLWIDWRA